mmetsp:Transcript_74404/g.151090  ORF Transcript_74404/g.151090 Transcript_74404/m.151090 type:complete len:202 (+) Transcript_74404:1626-2231(+)
MSALKSWLFVEDAMFDLSWLLNLLLAEYAGRPGVGPTEFVISDMPAGEYSLFMFIDFAWLDECPEAQLGRRGADFAVVLSMFLGMGRLRTMSWRDRIWFVSGWFSPSTFERSSRASTKADSASCVWRASGPCRRIHSRFKPPMLHRVSASSSNAVVDSPSSLARSAFWISRACCRFCRPCENCCRCMWQTPRLLKRFATNP